MSGTKGAILPSEARQIIANVDKYFTAEREKYREALNSLENVCITFQEPSDGFVTIPTATFLNLVQLLRETKKVTERVTLATGSSKGTLTRIRKESREAEASGRKIMTPKKGKRSKKIIPTPEEKGHQGKQNTTSYLNSMGSQFNTVESEATKTAQEQQDGLSASQSQVWEVLIALPTCVQTLPSCSLPPPPSLTPAPVKAIPSPAAVEVGVLSSTGQASVVPDRLKLPRPPNVILLTSAANGKPSPNLCPEMGEGH